MQENIATTLDNSHKRKMDQLDELIRNWYDKPKDYDEQVKAFPSEIKIQYILTAIDSGQESAIVRAKSLATTEPELISEELLYEISDKHNTIYQAADPSGAWETSPADATADLLEVYLKNNKTALSKRYLLVLAEKNPLTFDKFVNSEYKESFSQVDIEVIAKFVKKTKSEEIPKNPPYFSDEEAVSVMSSYPHVFELYWDWFATDSANFPIEMVKENPFLMAKHPEKFPDLSHNDLINLLTDKEKAWAILKNLDLYPTLDHNFLIQKMVENNDFPWFVLKDVIPKFHGLTKETADFLFENDRLDFIFSAQHAFPPEINGKYIWKLLSKNPNSERRKQFAEAFAIVKGINKNQILRKIFSTWDDEEIKELNLTTIRKFPQSVLDIYIDRPDSKKTEWLLSNLSFFEIKTHDKLMNWFLKNNKTLPERLDVWTFAESRMQNIQKIYRYTLNKNYKFVNWKPFLTYLYKNQDFPVPDDIENEIALTSWIIQLLLLSYDKFGFPEKEALAEIRASFSIDDWKEIVNQVHPLTGKKVFDYKSGSSITSETIILQGLEGKNNKEAEVEANRKFSNNEFFSELLCRTVEVYDLFNNYSAEQIEVALACLEKIAGILSALKIDFSEHNLSIIFNKMNNEVGSDYADEVFFEKLWEKLEKIDIDKFDLIKDSIEGFSRSFIAPLLLLKTEVFMDKDLGKLQLELAKTIAEDFLFLNNDQRLNQLGLPLTFSELALFAQTEHLPQHNFPENIKDLVDTREWKPLFSDPEYRFEWGKTTYFFVPLTSSQQLVDEGSAMSHCVGKGGYSDKCSKGTHHIVSIRKIVDGKMTRVSTLELESGKEGKISIIQNRGIHNHDPEDGAKKGAEEFLVAIKEKRVHLNDNPGEINKDSKKQSKLEEFKSKYPYLVSIGFIPTREKVLAVLEHYKKVSWNPPENKRKTKSIFVTEGIVTQGQNHFDYIHKLFLGLGREEASIENIIAKFGPILDEIIDQAYKKWADSTENLKETKEILA